MRLTWIQDDRLAASGMLYPGDERELARQGIGAVLSLTLRTPFPEGPPDGIAHLMLPVPDMTCPPAGDLERAVAFLGEQLAAGRRVLVHCGAGLGRTGTVVACFLAAEGRDAEAAIREVRARRPGSIETSEQEEGVREFVRRRGDRE